MKKVFLPLILFLFYFLISHVTASRVYAAGTVTATVLSPQGQVAASATYTFSKSGSADVTGTANSSGVISQSLDAGTWSLTITAPSSVQYVDPIVLGTVVVTDNVTLALGNVYFRFQVPSGSDSDLKSFGSEPSQCSVSGTPKIVRAYYEDELKGSFLFAGRSANIIIITDSALNTVTVDYSIFEGNPIGTNVEIAVSQGGGKFKATHTIANTALGGGIPIISVTRSGSTTGFCLPGGPVNLDIRTFFSGSETTNFASVSDFRAISNFTMHQANVVKVSFSKPVNMLDPIVQRFMKSIAQKMVSSTGSLNLDAKAVLELKNAGAIITMYGITLNSPKILVDGLDDTSGVASSLTYDKAAGTLTFNAAHFTTFTAVENTSSSGSSGTSADGNCKTGWKYCIQAGPNRIGGATVISGKGEADNQKVILSNNSTPHDVFISINKQASKDLLSAKVHFPWSQGFNTVGDIYNFQALSAFNGYPLPTFEKPVTVIVSYDPAKLHGTSPSALNIGYYDSVSGQWKILNSNTTVVDTKNHTLANTTKQLTYFTVLYPHTGGFTAPTAKPVITFTPTPIPTPKLKPQKAAILPQPEKKNKFCIAFFCF